MKTDLGTCELCAKRPAVAIVDDEFPPENAEGYEDFHIRVCLPCLPKWKRTQARLRLEAAAPDLLAALKDAIRFAEAGTYPGPAFFGDWRAAIAKAEGGAA